MVNETLESNKQFILNILYKNIKINTLSFERCYTKFYYTTIIYFSNIDFFKNWLDEITKEIDKQNKIIYNIQGVNDILMYPINLYKKKK